MKNTQMYIFAILVVFSFNANAALKIDSIILNDKTIVSSAEISSVVMIPHSLDIDYVELKEGSRIESTEINQIIEKHKFNRNLNQAGIDGAKIGGDGSGG